MDLLKIIIARLVMSADHLRGYRSMTICVVTERWPFALLLNTVHLHRRRVLPICLVTERQQLASLLSDGYLRSWAEREMMLPGMGTVWLF